MLIFLGIGSNLGDKTANMQRAVCQIDDCMGQVCWMSDVINTAPWGYQSENDYLNQVVLIHTDLNANDLLRRAKEIERGLGRTQKSEQHGDRVVYHDRTIDIDILLAFRCDNISELASYSDITSLVEHSVSVNSADLTIPHPLLMQRDFVTIPLQQFLNEHKQ